MSARCCKHIGKSEPVRRTAAVGGWLLPVAVIALMPKCPVCLAGYVALATGFGISISAASGLRTALLIIAGAVLLYFILNKLCQIRRSSA